MVMAFHRKYRPLRVSELDQEKVRKRFEKVLETGEVAQAYLFSGPRGTGKTSSARILAAVLNCDKNEKASVAMLEKDGKGLSKKRPVFAEPCGECDSCRAIRAGASTAVVEIDAASNRGIDDIRQLRDRVGLVPGDGLVSVYIIDEVHMLTKEAFNALLKTLEEPPRHVVFCLCTTEEHKLPDTVVSRCVKVGFARASSDEVARSFSRVMKDLGLKVEKEAAEMIAKMAEGSFRDAMNLLERFKGVEEKVTVTMVKEELGGGESVPVLFELMIEGQTKRALGVVEQLEASGAEPKWAARELVEMARERMVESIETGGEVGEYVELIEVMGKAFSRFSGVPIAMLPVEMAVVEYCLGREGGTGGQSKTVVEPNKIKRVEKEAEKKAAVGQKADKEPEAEHGKVENGGKDKSVSVLGRMTERFGVDEELVREKWSQVLQLVEKENHGLVTLLKRAKVDKVMGDQIGLVVGYKFHKEQLEQHRYLEIVERVLETVYGGRLKVKCLVESGRLPKELKEHENLSGKIEGDDASLAAAVEEVFGVS